MINIDSLLSKLNNNLSETTADQLGAKVCQIAEAMSGQDIEFNPDQLAQYDIMLCQFTANIEAIALSKLAFIFSNMESGPPNMVDKLARHDDIVVAGPILANSPMLDDSLLREIIGSKGQMHLQAVCDRASLTESVTSALLERGDSKTRILLARNTGACFNNQGFATLVGSAQSDEALAIMVGGRSDIPPKHLEVLIKAASEHVRKELVQANPKIESIVNSVVEKATLEVTNAAPEAAAELVQAQKYVTDLYRNGKLDTNAILEFANQQAANETLIAMALLCRIDASAAFRAFNETGTDTALMMAKACGLPKDGARTVLLAFKRGLPQTDIDQVMSTYARLKPETARRVLKLRFQTQGQDLSLRAPKPN